MSSFAKFGAVVIFFLTWILILPQKWSFLPIGRSMSALFGASLMMSLKIVSIQEAFSFINEGIQVLVLLFGLMILSNYCDKEGFFNVLEKALIFRCKVCWDLVLRIVVASGVLSAFITNDAVCIFLTPPIVRIAKKYQLEKALLLVALGTSSNIGSAATISGNPQNAYIGIQSGITYLHFMSKLGLVSIFGLFINYGCLWLYYSKGMKQMLISSSLNSSKSKRATVNESQLHDDDNCSIRLTSISNNNLSREKVLGLCMRIILIFILFAVVLFFIIGFNLALVSLAGALWIIVFEALVLKYEPKPMLHGVDFQLLIFFCGLFIVVGTLTNTGYPQMIWDSIFNSLELYSTTGITVFSVIVTLASNLISNVPAVMLASPLLLGLLNSRLAWLLLAWVSTIAGNLTIIGSAAMIIVAERAYQADSSYMLSSWKYIFYGIPSTIIITCVTVPLVCGIDKLY